jgi:hypothetical protein
MHLPTACELSWVGEHPPYYRDWRGKQLYQALFAGSRRGTGA